MWLFINFEGVTVQAFKGKSSWVVKTSVLASSGILNKSATCQVKIVEEQPDLTRANASLQKMREESAPCVQNFINPTAKHNINNNEDGGYTDDDIRSVPWLGVDTQLDKDQLAAIKTILELDCGDVVGVEAGPACGKTKCVAAMAHAWSILKPGSRVLVTAPCNTAACAIASALESLTDSVMHVCAERAMCEPNAEGALDCNIETITDRIAAAPSEPLYSQALLCVSLRKDIRSKKPTGIFDMSLSKMRQKYDEITTEITDALIEKGRSIIVSTLCKGSRIGSLGHWSLVIVDEAGIVGDERAVLALERAQRLAFVGDYRWQLQPRLQHTTKRHQSCLERVCEGTDTDVMLRTQYRSRKGIFRIS